MHLVVLILWAVVGVIKVVVVLFHGWASEFLLVVKSIVVSMAWQLEHPPSEVVVLAFVNFLQVIDGWSNTSDGLEVFSVVLDVYQGFVGNVVIVVLVVGSTVVGFLPFLFNVFVVTTGVWNWFPLVLRAFLVVIMIFNSMSFVVVGAVLQTRSLTKMYRLVPEHLKVQMTI